MAAFRSSFPRIAFPRIRCRPLARALLLAQFAAPALLAGWPAGTLHAQQASLDFDIPAGPLDQALVSFGRQSGIGVSADAALTAGLRSGGLHGRYAADAALPVLLSGTGLVARIDAGTAIVQRPARDGVRATAPLRVQGEGEGETSPRGAQRDRKGYDDVYDLDLSTVYAGKAQIERYKGAAPADIFKGMVNVYSGDARNSGALDPNIRGIQGPGRVPVTIDGTEQALTVWRGYMGANNRAYIDPNLIGGLQVVKGPSLARNVAPGIGGAVVISTLDVDDVLKPGERFGGELKLEGSNNAVDPRLPTLLTGQRIAGSGLSSTAADMFDPTLYVMPRGSGSNHLLSGNDYAWRLALGLRQDRFDLMAAYAYRQKGNHYAGKHGSGFYSREATSSYDYIPYLARLYAPGSEVPNTSSQMESWLVKGTWRPGDDQALQLNVRKTHALYGEILPSRITWLDAAEYGVPQWPLSHVQTRAYNLEYTWRPAGSRWLDLYANLWATDTDSDTYTRGGLPNDTGAYTLYLDGRWQTFSPEYVRNTALANARNTRNGVTLSNRFQLAEDIDLTVGASLQREKLRSDDVYGDPQTTASYQMFPRAGRRREHEFNFDFEMRPADWLKVTAGMRYQSYWSFDDFLDGQIRAGNGALATSSVRTGYDMEYDTTQTYTYTEADIASQVAGYQTFIRNWQRRLAAGSVSASAAQAAIARYTALIEQAYATVGTTYEVTTTHHATWMADANGKLSRADNPCTNGYVASQGSECKSWTMITASQTLDAVRKRRDHGWVPAFSATISLSDYSRIYLRHSQAIRFPSLFESTLGFSSAVSFYDLKPEHAYNDEIAYVHDLSRLLGVDDGHADVKLSYYRLRTKDVIERDANLKFSNLDRQVIRGIEFQGRYDNGGFFTDLGASYNLENTVCDESTAAELDKLGGAVPNCVKNGFVGGYLASMAIPKYTLNWSVGGRFFQRRLELGARLVHYDGYENVFEDNYGDQAAMISYYLNTPLQWDDITTYDAYASYRFRDGLAMELVGTNLGNRYYIDPLTRSAMLAPGRTLKLSLTYTF